MEKKAQKISLLAISTAVVAVFTMAVRIPMPATGGYVSLCDAAIFFVSIAFGPLAGFLSGGLGTALSDMLGGYPQWAAISFLVHGLEGLAVGLIMKKENALILRKAVSVALTSIIVAFGYFLLTGLFLDSYVAAAAEIVPNLIQGVVGGVAGLILYEAVRKGYRAIDSMKF